MIEIIKRKDGEKSEKTQIQHGGVQISYNSHGHLVVRIIQGNKQDALIVFNHTSSNEIIEFCQEQLTPRRMRKNIEDMLNNLPF